MTSLGLSTRADALEKFERRTKGRHFVFSHLVCVCRMRFLLSWFFELPPSPPLSSLAELETCSAPFRCTLTSHFGHTLHTTCPHIWSFRQGSIEQEENGLGRLHFSLLGCTWPARSPLHFLVGSRLVFAAWLSFFVAFGFLPFSFVRLRFTVLRFFRLTTHSFCTQNGRNKFQSTVVFRRNPELMAVSRSRSC